MTETNANGWSTDHSDGKYLRRYKLALLGKGGITGLIGGMAAFTYSMAPLMAASVSPKLVLALVALAGVFADALARDLRESIYVGLIGTFVGIFTLIGSWIAPLWVLPYSSGARDLLLPKLTGPAVVASLIIYMGTFLGAYLAALVVGAYVST